MKMLVVAGMAAMVSFGLWSSADHEVLADLDPVVSGTVATRIASTTGARSYSISNIVASTACLAERGEKVSSRSLRFAAGKDCEQVWPGLSQAQTWTENGDGTVVVADARGEAILTVVDGDGLAYEVMDPPDAMVTLVATD
jgi:hypothetical protein